MNKSKDQTPKPNPDKFTWKAGDIEWEDDPTAGDSTLHPSTDNSGPSKGWLGKLNAQIQRDVGGNK